ncbi:hypothetical protein [Streptomyces europaeiscabiei]|uniref:hypothetical protein n=1 Tax=Streptomyces europaeiscabiei TaxID=146819 RepID=UPI002E1769D4
MADPVPLGQGRAHGAFPCGDQFDVEALGMDDQRDRDGQRVDDLRVGSGEAVLVRGADDEVGEVGPGKGERTDHGPGAHRSGRGQSGALGCDDGRVGSSHGGGDGGHDGRQDVHGRRRHRRHFVPQAVEGPEGVVPGPVHRPVDDPLETVTGRGEQRGHDRGGGDGGHGLVGTAAETAAVTPAYRHRTSAVSPPYSRVRRTTAAMAWRWPGAAWAAWPTGWLWALCLMPLHHAARGVPRRPGGDGGRHRSPVSRDNPG